MAKFEFSPLFNRVIFGTNTIDELPEELARLNLSDVVVLSTPQQQDLALQISRLLGSKSVGVFAEATMHTPTNITDKAVQFIGQAGADSVVSAGGGSTIGLGKAISIRTGIPHISIPTTYAGSEMTSILGETSEGRKTTRRDPRILPGTVIYDTNLTMTLPPSLTATSGINAIAHAVEALYAKNVNPIISLLALDGIRSLCVALPTLKDSPRDVQARSDAFYGSWLCGVCLGNADMGLHHKLCHVLGGSFNLPHAETHTIILPHALAYNATVVPGTMQKLSEVIPCSNGDAIDGLNQLLRRLGVTRSLKDLGMKEEDVDKAAEIAMSNPYNNLRSIEHGSIRELIWRAWAGQDAKADL